MEDYMRKLIFLLISALLLASCAHSPTPTGTCEMTAVNPVTVYMRASAAADPFGTLGASQAIQATVKTADGFFGFDPGVAQAGNSGLFRMRWVLKTHDVTTSPGCASLPTATSPIAGICYAMIMTDTSIYSSPDAGSSVLVTLHLNDYAMVTASAPGWYTLDLNVGTVNIENLGYLQDSNLGGFNGPCDGF
jgi:hypothetical protein